MAPLLDLKNSEQHHFGSHRMPCSDNQKFSVAFRNKNQCFRDQPRRALSAYNIFFQHERKKILSKFPDYSSGNSTKSRGKVGFGSLARTIAAKWKTLDKVEKKDFETLAAEEKERYKKEKKQWMQGFKLSKEFSDACKQIASGITNANEPEVHPAAANKKLKLTASDPHKKRDKIASCKISKRDLFLTELPPLQKSWHISKLADMLDDECIEFLQGLFPT